MSEKILQINLNYSVSRAELEEAWIQAAQPISDQPGLIWKVWLINEADQEAGGIYLFESGPAAQAYLEGPICASLKASPVISNITAKVFDVLDKHTEITRGPLKAIRRVGV